MSTWRRGKRSAMTPADGRQEPGQREEAEGDPARACGAGQLERPDAEHDEQRAVAEEARDVACEEQAEVAVPREALHARLRHFSDVRHYIAREELLVLDRHPVRRAAGVDGDADLRDALAQLARGGDALEDVRGRADPDVVVGDELLERALVASPSMIPAA